MTDYRLPTTDYRPARSGRRRRTTKSVPIPTLLPILARLWPLRFLTYLSHLPPHHTTPTPPPCFLTAPTMFSFISNKASTCAECRSLGSGKSTSKFDKRTIGRPSAYEWPAFQPRPQPRPQPRSQPVVYGPPPTAAQIQVLLYRGPRVQGARH